MGRGFPSCAGSLSGFAGLCCRTGGGCGRLFGRDRCHLHRGHGPGTCRLDLRQGVHVHGRFVQRSGFHVHVRYGLRQGFHADGLAAVVDPAPLTWQYVHVLGGRPEVAAEGGVGRLAALLQGV